MTDSDAQPIVGDILDVVANANGDELDHGAPDDPEPDEVPAEPDLATADPIEED